MLMACLNPNPQALTNGATVMSKAPSVSADIFWDRVNTSIKCVLRIVSSLWLMRVMMELGL